MRRICAAIAVLLCGAAVAVAQSVDARKAQVDAAVANAVEGLYSDVAHTVLYNRLTVGELIDKVGGHDEVIHTLQGAQEIGGPRWLDDQTAQVRLEIAGGSVARTLVQLAASNPKKTPISASALAPILVDWDRRTFAAVGSSIGSSAVVDVRPGGADSFWATIPEATRKEAIAAAHRNATQRAIDAVGSVDLKAGLTGAQTMERSGSPMRADLERFVDGRPVTSVQFREDGQVEVGVSAPAADLADVMRGALNAMHDPHVADIDWAHVRQQIDGKIGTAVVGVAIVRVARQPATAIANIPALPTVNIPNQPPDWVWKQLDADAAARGGDSALKCARAAERAAVEKLRGQVEGLSLGGTTIGEAARKDPRIADAVARGLSHARVFKSDYHADGTVVVSVSLNLQELWGELHPF